MEKLKILAASLVQETKKLLNIANTEEDLKIGFEKLLEPIKKQLGIKIETKYEKTVVSGRSDAIHGEVVIEYKSPRFFCLKKDEGATQKWSETKIKETVSQLKKYLLEEMTHGGKSNIVGVGFDGETIFFVHYQGKNLFQMKEKEFLLIGPYDFNENSCLTFLNYLLSLYKIPFTADRLVESFGPESPVAKASVSAFVFALKEWAKRGCNRRRVETFYQEWKRLFGIVYGSTFASKSEATKLAKSYGVEKDLDFQDVLFGIHTYYAFLMKIIVAELLKVQVEGTNNFCFDLAHANRKKLIDALKDIESGHIYYRLGITNFLEGDFFKWYLFVLAPRLEEALRSIFVELSRFDLASVAAGQVRGQDLLRKLYQHLVPQVIRHHLGEYYTPDWLAELVLKEVGWEGQKNKRLLDPACGSGTFLSKAIVSIIKNEKEEGLNVIETVKQVLANIWGFDLNPLAVIAARTNYLLSLGDLGKEFLSAGGRIEIPVYLADSVLWPQRSKLGELDFTGGFTFKVSTSVGDFFVPALWVKEDWMLSSAMEIIERSVRNETPEEIVLHHLKKENLLTPDYEKVAVDFYRQILDLEKKEKNGIWTRFLRNVFAPYRAWRNQFDYVVGNPPWIRWSYLSTAYRKVTSEIWKEYGLFSLKGFKARLGGGEKDFSMLFTYACANHYLKEKGRLAFLITQEVFKAKGAGEGFRRFIIGENGSPLKVLKAWDLVKVKPFEGAANKTAMIVLKKGEKTEYPVQYIFCERKTRKRIPEDWSLEKAKKLLKMQMLQARPVSKITDPWLTLPEGKENLFRIAGPNVYKARRGASFEPYGVFWLKVLTVKGDGNVIVKNRVEAGKRNIPEVEATIESDLIYPALRGADIKRWGCNWNIYVLMPYKQGSKEPYSEKELQEKYPMTYDYLLGFKEILLGRRSQVIIEHAARTAFYTLFGIGSYTFAPYRVVWRRMSDDIYATVVSETKTLVGWKPLVGTDTTSLFAVEDEEEAHFLCAVINSEPVRNFIKGFSSAGRGFGAPSVMDRVKIPLFDRKKEIHRRLSVLSMECHFAVARGDNPSEMEKEIDTLVSKMFGLV